MGTIIASNGGDVKPNMFEQTILKPHPGALPQIFFRQIVILRTGFQHVVKQSNIVFQLQYDLDRGILHDLRIVAQKVVCLPTQGMFNLGKLYHFVDVPVHIVVQNKKARFFKPSYIDICVVQEFEFLDIDKEIPVILKADPASGKGLKECFKKIYHSKWNPDCPSRYELSVKRYAIVWILT
jgi:hypothetical protein